MKSDLAGLVKFLKNFLGMVGINPDAIGANDNLKGGGLLD
jgi:hypothetical protein